MPYEIIATEFFERRAKKLKRKYPNIKNDLLELVASLEAGNLQGIPISGLKNRVYKTRIKSSDLKKGKSGSFRVVYYLKTERAHIYLITIYAKAEIETISSSQINDILQKIGLS